MKNPILSSVHNFSRSDVRRIWVPGTRACTGIMLISTLLLTSCTSTPKQPEGAEALRSKLSQLQSDPNLAPRAPVAMREAEEAVKIAEQPTKDKELSTHRLWMADSRLEIARARAQSHYNEDLRSQLSQERESARLDSRTQEADSARLKTNDLLKEIAELNAKPTDRGLVMTLGDLLFATGNAEIKGSSSSNLDKLASFLKQYPERTVVIEGHTDNTGSAEFNRSLSQRRADSVKAYLVQQGVNSSRLSTMGKGFDSPVTNNDTATGRQQNRRVEIVISEPAAASI